MNILVVDDNPGDVNLLKEAFRELNSRAIISVASDGEECLRLLLSAENSPASYPDLIFLDLNLPTVSGYDVLRHIKSDARTRHIPVIVLSSSRTEEEIERAYGEYANAYVQKPGTMTDLLIAARGLKSFWMETARLSSSFAGN